MSKKKKEKKVNTDFDPDLLRDYMMGATNPGFSNKFEMREEVVDLHLEKTNMGSKIPPQDALFHQLDEFEKALDKAVAAGRLELRIVHGLGKGKLKEEIFKLLDKHPHVKTYSNEYSTRYGYGSTLISFY
jgi:hypothetical protein